jgi:CheY-like chemotaxis protein
LHLLVKESLKGKDYQIEFASEGVDGINQAQLKKPDLIDEVWR